MTTTIKAVGLAASLMLGSVPAMAGGWWTNGTGIKEVDLPIFDRCHQDPEIPTPAAAYEKYKMLGAQLVDKGDEVNIVLPPTPRTDGFTLFYRYYRSRDVCEQAKQASDNAVAAAKAKEQQALDKYR